MEKETKRVKLSTLISSSIIIVIATIAISVVGTLSLSKKMEQQNNENIENAILQMPVTLNGGKHQVKVECSNVIEENHTNYLQRFKMSIDEKVVLGIEDEDIVGIEGEDLEKETVFVIPEISKIVGKDKKEYLLLKTVGFNTTVPDSSRYYVIDENGNNIGNVEEYNKFSVIVKDEWGEDRVLNMFGTILQGREDGNGMMGRIRKVEVLNTGDVVVHEYDIENGQLKDNIVEQYSADQVELAQ